MALKLWRHTGWGSAIVEAQAAEYGIELDLIDIENPAAEQARATLLEVNPLGQLPTLWTEDGKVLTESAAITLWLAEQSDSTLLVPEIEAPERADFLRWLIWLVANIYPAATYYEHVDRYISDPIEAGGFRTRVMANMKVMWQQADAAAVGPWFLGERYTALDIYLAVMLHWGPGLDWFAEHTPKLYNIGKAAAGRPAVAPVITQNFPELTGF